MDKDTMTVDDVISALTAIEEVYGGDIPAVMLLVENDEPLNITSVNVGLDEEGHPVANVTTDEYSHITIARRRIDV